MRTSLRSHEHSGFKELIKQPFKESISQFANLNTPASQGATESQIPIKPSADPPESYKEIHRSTTRILSTGPIIFPITNIDSMRGLLVVRGKRTSEAALAEVVLDSALLGSGGLCEGD